MSMYSLLRSKSEAPTETEIEDNLAGNLWYGLAYVQLAFPQLSCLPTNLLKARSCIVLSTSSSE